MAMKRWLWLSVLVCVLDQASKVLVLALLHPGQVIELVPNINLTLLFNRGAAFSFLAGAGGWQRWLFVALALSIGVALVIWLLRLPRGWRMHAAGLALLIGGAFGNLLDRLLYGYVVDFIQIYIPALPLAMFNPWPAFNIADSAITLGVILLLGANLFESSAPRQDAPDAAQTPDRPSR